MKAETRGSGTWLPAKDGSGSWSTRRKRWRNGWAAIEPHFRTRLAGLVEMFGTARSKELGDDDLENVAASAVAARVGTLLTEADRHIPGRIDPDTGEIVLGGGTGDDVLDDIAELVLKNGGQVVIVPNEQMPTRTGVAAIYRF